MKTTELQRQTEYKYGYPKFNQLGFNNNPTGWTIQPKPFAFEQATHVPQTTHMRQNCWLTEKTVVSMKSLGVVTGGW